MTNESRDVPVAVRVAVYERDAGCCRVCGRYADPAGLHHIIYKSQGGLNVVENLVTIGWIPGHDCHGIVHSNKPLWMPLLQAVLARGDGITARQMLRWYRA